MHRTKRVQLIQNYYHNYYSLQGQQLMDLEHKLAVAKEELEKTALDKVSNRETLVYSWFSHISLFTELFILSHTTTEGFI